ncbi:MAG: DUF3105 domain-containing protein [Chloroflexi bacterium]|nr:DUF3105 domain-containing protein [Chloroflexota bacterium]
MAARERDRRRRSHHRAEAREIRRTRQHSRKRIRRIIFGGIAGLGALLIVLSLVLPNSLGNIGSSNVSSSEQGVEAAIQENKTIEVGDSHAAYNTTPPTSGWHYDIPLEDITWGPQDEPIEDEVQVSYLKRGGIMVQYSCPDECNTLQQQLKLVVNRYPEGVIMAPYPDMDTTLALTAWSWIDTFENFDDPRIDDFIQTHIGRGPESFR